MKVSAVFSELPEWVAEGRPVRSAESVHPGLRGVPDAALSRRHEHGCECPLGPWIRRPGSALQPVGGVARCRRNGVGSMRLLRAQRGVEGGGSTGDSMLAQSTESPVQAARPSASAMALLRC